MRAPLLIVLALASTLAAAAPTSFATARDAAQFLRNHLGIDNPAGPLALVGRKLAAQLAQGFDPRSEDGPGADDLGDDIDDVRPDADGFRAAPRADAPDTSSAPTDRALTELRRAYENGVLSRTVRRTLTRLARTDGATPVSVRVAILRVRTDRAEYRALVDALSRDILAAATAELVHSNEQIADADADGVVVAQRVPAAEPDTADPNDRAPLAGWPWLLGAACAVLALSLHNLLRARRRYEHTARGAETTTFADDDRFDSVTQVRPVRPGIHERDPRDP